MRVCLVITPSSLNISFYRDLYPVLLRKSDRGKHHNPNSQPVDYGCEAPAEGVDGVDLLEAYEKGDIVVDSDGRWPQSSLLLF